MPRNITNGEFTLNYNEEDRVDNNYKFQRVPGYDSLDSLRVDNKKTKTNFYIESKHSNIQISGMESSPRSQRTI